MSVCCFPFRSGDPAVFCCFPSGLAYTKQRKTANVFFLLCVDQKLVVLANVEAFFLVGFGYAQGQNHVGYFQQQQ